MQYPVGFYQETDCVLVLSRSESQSRVTLEAMLAEAVVLANAVGGIRDLIQDGSTGFLIDPDQPGSIRGTLMRLASDPAEVAEVRQRAREYATGVCTRSSQDWRSFLVELIG